MKIIVLLIATLICVSTFADPRYIKSELKPTMQKFSAALGVKCDYCHLDDKEASITNTKWKTDAEHATLVHQKVARAMIGTISVVNKDATTKYDCMKCHQGKTPQ